MNPPAPVPDPTEFWTSRRFLLVLTLVLLAAFPKVVLGGTSFFFHDAGALGYPVAHFFQQTVGRGELPLWNSYSHCGVPFLAQLGQWYPGTWLGALLPFPWSLNLLLLLHLLLGGWGMYALTRRWGMTGFAATFAGLAYVFNGVSFSCFQWSNYAASFGWLPWVVLAVTEAWRRGGRWLVLAALASALQVLTATPELTLLGWSLLAALWLAELLAGKITFWVSARRVALVVLVAAGLTMIQMLPFFDLLAHSQRDTNYEQSVWAMPVWGWANLLVPLFHNYLSPQGNWFQHNQDFLMSYYLGLGVLALAVMGVWLNRTRTALVLAGAAGLCWVLALGDAGYVYPLAKKIFPWLGIARFPVKFTLLTAFLIPPLAAWAVDAIQTGADARTRRCVWCVGGAVLALTAALALFAWAHPLPYDAVQAMLGNTAVRLVLLLALLALLLALARWESPRGRRLGQLAVLGILLADVFTHSPGITPTLPGSVFAPGLWSAGGQPVPPLGAGRIMLSPAAEQRMLYSRVADPQLDFLGKRLAEWYNLNLLDSLPKVNGAFTLRPAEFDRVERQLYFTAGAGCGRGFLDFLSAAWVSDPANPAKWVARTNYLPVMTAGQRPEFASDDEALARLTASTFDPRAVVYLPASARGQVTASNETSCVLSQVRFGQNQVRAEVQAAAPSLVVLSQTYYHLWRAEVDGQPVPLLRANVAFQAVPVPAGVHQVRLVYRDVNLLAGAGITLFSLLLCGVIWRRSPS